MKVLISNFAHHIEDAVEIGKATKLHHPKFVIKNAVISGLGGSGIGGTIVSEMVAGEAIEPILVNKDYFLPAFVNRNTLVIISSYSGNTEETLNAMEIAVKKKAKVICITSGGKIHDLAKENGIDLILIPKGMPPRAALAFSLIQLLYVLYNFGIITKRFEKELYATVDLLRREEKEIAKEANMLARKLYRKIPVIYAAAGFEGVAVRFRQQLNENAKVLCWHNVIPEMNHNELVGWLGTHENLAVVFFRNKNDFSRVQKRIELNKEVILKCAGSVTEIYSKGNTALEKAIYLIHLGDWTSYYLAELNEVDILDVKAIDYLKSSLAKM